VHTVDAADGIAYDSYHEVLGLDLPLGAKPKKSETPSGCVENSL